MKRPLVLVTLPYVGGILVGEFISLPPLVLLGISLAPLLVALAWTKARGLLLWPLLFLAGLTNLTLHTAILSPHDLRKIFGQQPELAAVRGILRETPSLRLFEADDKESWRTMARLEVTAVQ